jgi:hypothetical protein
MMTSNPPFIRINNIGSRLDGCTIFNLEKGMYVQCGCVFCSVDEFIDKVKEKHGSNKFALQYTKAIELAKITFKE